MPTLKLPPKIESQLAGLPQCARTYALAKAAHETHAALAKAECDEIWKRVEATDPDPDIAKYCHQTTPPAEREAKLAEWRTASDAWMSRHADDFLACDKINEKHKLATYRELLKQAEDCLVQDTADRMKAERPKDFTRIERAFQAWFDGELYGEMRARLLEICFHCPPEMGQRKAA